MLNAKSIGLATAFACLAAASTARAASFVTITDPANPNFTEALGINNSGTIVGYGNELAFNGFRLTPPIASNNFTRENFPASSGTQVTGIDSAGNTVGSYFVGAAGFGFYRNTGGTYSSINQPGAPFNQLLGINQNGTTAVGYASRIDPTGMQGQVAYTYNIGSMSFTPITTLPLNNNSQATGVNNSGMVVGFYKTLSGNYSAFTDVGGMITSFEAPGSMSTQALGINDLGQIVGDYVDSVGVMHGFFDNGGMFTTLDVLGATGTTANGINDLGQIVGFYTDANDNTIGFETQVSAVPLPASFPLFATGLGALGLLGWRRKRKAAPLDA